MLSSYFPILVMLLIAAGFVTAMILAAIFLGPRKHTAVKDEPFECGTVGTGSAAERLSVKFYLVAMIFILFDIEVVFLYPWAVQAASLGWTGFWTMMTFILVLVAGLAYIWKRGVLDWG
jgi:NADH-quinone oxidoreductase subunit A